MAIKIVIYISIKLPGGTISFEQEREKWADWPSLLARPILPVSPFPFENLLRHPVFSHWHPISWFFDAGEHLLTCWLQRR